MDEESAEGPLKLLKNCVLVPADLNQTPPRAEGLRDQTVDDLEPYERAYYEADKMARQQILMVIPNNIYRSVDAYKDAHLQLLLTLTMHHNNNHLHLNKTKLMI